MSDWDTYQTAAPNSGLAEAAQEYQALTRQQEELQAKIEALHDKILAEFSEESGEQTMVADHYAITVNRQERWTWDADMLDDLFGNQEELPTHVKKRLTVDKRRFQTLDDEDKRLLLPALTRKPGPAKISVKETS